MKYIVLSDDSIFLFPDNIDHDTMAEALVGLRNKTSGNWERTFSKPVAAGFVDGNLKCFGRSETLDLKSRKEDTALLKSKL